MQQWLLGITPDGEHVFLEDFQWSCGWYWSGGMLTTGYRDSYESLRERYEDDEDYLRELWKDAVQNDSTDESFEDFRDDIVDSLMEDIEMIDECADGETYISWDSHTHFSSYFDKNESVEEYFSETQFSKDEWYRLLDLMKQFYALQKTAEVFNHGGHITSYGRTDAEMNPNMAAIINSHIKEVIIPEVQSLCERNAMGF